MPKRTEPRPNFQAANGGKRALGKHAGFEADDWQVIAFHYFVEVHCDGDVDVTKVRLQSANAYAALHPDEMRQCNLPALADYLTEIMGPSTPFTAAELQEKLEGLDSYMPVRIYHR